ncbi:MAG TPA: hypothetical protein VFS15_22705 [Kofleriaceae bacterium]|nr:hypothetical protein [Kofleriaceae bacterium]
MRICVALVALLACKGREPPLKSAPVQEAQVPAGSAAAPAVQTITTHCPQQPFAESTPLAEASGAAWLTIDGALALVVVADSGNDGAYAILDPDTGETREQGKLPLGGGDDDIEGLAAHGDRLYGLTSRGWMRVWRRHGKGFELVEGPYAIGQDSDGTSCAAKKGCPIDYEGLALAPEPHGCAGFACSKGDGHLYCLTEQGGHYVVDRARRIAVTSRKGQLADCAFDERGTLWAGNNVFGLDQVYRIDNWQAPEAAKVVSFNAFGVGFPEVIAARDGVIYRMSDTGGAPSLLGKFRCSDATR